MFSSFVLRRTFVFAVLGLSIARAASEQFSGAVYTSTRDGSVVNANQYESGSDVYLNGGPQNESANGLPDGIYYFQVTDPSGATLLSLDAATCRQLLVVDGRVAGAREIQGEIQGAHANGVFNPANASLSVQLWPFAPSPNGGNEYKVWLIRQTVDTTVDALDARVIHFNASDAKTDNFKVVQAVAALTISSPADLTLCNDAGKDGATVTLPAVATSGGVAPVTVSFSRPSGSFFPVGRTDVVATAIDAVGTTASCTFAVNVTDCEGPRFAPNAPRVFNAVLASGACTATVSFGAELFVDASGVASVTFTPASGSAFAAGTSTVSYKATDGQGNVSDGTFLVDVKDSTPPTIAPIADIEVSTAPGLCTATVSFAPVATDCSTVSVTTSHASGATFPKGNTPVTVTATDAYGNTATSVFTVVVRDREKPVLNLPGTIVVSTDPGKCSAVVNYQVSATDNCGPVQITIDGLASGTAFPKGTTLVTVTAVDGSGNVTTGSFGVVVKDTEFPSIAAPADIVAPLATIYGSPLAIGTAVASDNCGVAALTGVRSDGRPLSDPYPAGLTTVTWTAVDDAGNAVSATQTITVVGGTIVATKFYDANANGARDGVEVLLAGWKIKLVGVDSAGNAVTLSGLTTTDGTPSFSGLPIGTYTLSEMASSIGSWISTLPTTQAVSITSAAPDGRARFAGLSLGSGGGLTLGFWSNKNGEKTLSTALASNLAALSALNLRTATGAEFNPGTYASYNTWVLAANATNMAYMLSAQLSAMHNNVNIRPNAFGGVNGGALIYAPGAQGANAAGVITVTALLAEANAALATAPVTIQASPTRTYQEALKTALDNGNNNRNFVQASAGAFGF